MSKRTIVKVLSEAHCAGHAVREANKSVGVTIWVQDTPMGPKVHCASDLDPADLILTLHRVLMDLEKAFSDTNQLPGTGSN